MEILKTEIFLFYFFFLLLVLSVTKEIFAFRPDTNNVDDLSGSYVRASLSVTA